MPHQCHPFGFLGRRDSFCHLHGYQAKRLASNMTLLVSNAVVVEGSHCDRGRGAPHIEHRYTILGLLTSFYAAVPPAPVPAPPLATSSPIATFFVSWLIIQWIVQHLRPSLPVPLSTAIPANTQFDLPRSFLLVLRVSLGR